FLVYGDRDNYAVINKQGVVRYNAYDHWPYGNRFHLDELRGTIDSLLTVTVDVDDAPRSFGLTASPRPAHGPVSLTLANPGTGSLAARVAVYGLAGREVALVWRGAAAPGLTHLTWAGNGAAAPGLYLVRAKVGERELTRRLLWLR